MEWLPVLLLLALLGAAAFRDLRHQRIDNAITYPGIVVGVICRSLQGDGFDGLVDSLSGILVCGGLMVVAFVLFELGGGDVKLITMAGAFLGPRQGVEAIVWTFVIGAVVALAMVIWQLGVWHILRRTVHHLRLVFKAKGWIAPTPSEREPLRRPLYLAPCGLLGVCMAVFGPNWF